MARSSAPVIAPRTGGSALTEGVRLSRCYPFETFQPSAEGSSSGNPKCSPPSEWPSGISRVETPLDATTRREALTPPGRRRSPDWTELQAYAGLVLNSIGSNRGESVEPEA
jgi:hypothetical protein